jgi:uroporphyrinogen-III synthase
VRILVTRPEERAGELAAALERLGHEVIVCPLIAVEPLGDAPIDLTGYDWVIVTSRTGARELARRRSGPLPRLAAIGPGTAAELAARGLLADLVPVVSTQEGLAAELPRPAGRVLFAGAERARRWLAAELGADFLALYRTVELDPERLPRCDVAVLASASAARAYASAGAPVPAICIGPQTSAAARGAGVRVAAEARTHDLAGLVDAVRALAK